MHLIIFLSIAIKKPFMQRISPRYTLPLGWKCSLTLAIKWNLGSRSEITYSEQWGESACWLLVAHRWTLCRDTVPYGDAWFVLFPAPGPRYFPL